MAESRVKVPSQEAQGMDFLAFSFNGKHSWDDFHIYRTSDGDRYNENLTPTLTDKTAEVPGGDGMYYFGTTHKQRDFNISFAFDGLTEVELRELKRWLNGKEMGDLWFQETPYKVWTAKPTGNSSIKYIPFDDENGQRVYKGEGTVRFVAYWPYAHTPDYVGATGTASGKIWSNYDGFNNQNQWGISSGLAKMNGAVMENSRSTTCVGENLGDLPTHFVFKYNGSITSTRTFVVGELTITVSGTSSKPLNGITWDSKTGMVTAKVGGAPDYTPIPYTGTSTGAIPIGGTTTLDLGGGTLNYHYWYY